MFDFAAARQNMVDGQIRPNAVTDLRIIAAMLELPRERFLPASDAIMAYLDLELPVGNAAAARRMLKPMILARLVQTAEIGARDRVLDVGCLTGYSSALLASLAEDVTALEVDGALAQRARENLRELGRGRVEVLEGPLSAGAPAHAPFDVILLNGASEIEPATLFGQLKNGGRLVGVFGKGPAAKGMCYLSVDGDVSGRPIFDAAAPLLPGFVAPPAFVF